MPYGYIPRTEIDAYAVQQGRWVIGLVETTSYWPSRNALVDYEACRFLLMPAQPIPDTARATSPAIAVEGNSQGLSEGEARVRILEFASALSWQDGLPLEIVGWSGGNLARPVSMQTMSTVSHDFEARHLPIGATDVAKTAMAFYREGVSIGNPFYAYLSLYKAFSVAVPNGKGREAWINAALPTLTSRTAVERLNVLVQGGVDIAKHLYDGNRHSIAHADKEPFVNPDRDDDRRRIALDIPLMRELAESAIEQNLGVDRLVTAYVKHSYELTGLAKRVIPREFVEQMQAGNAAGECTIDAPDELALVARCGEVIEIVSPVREAQWELDATGITLVALSPDRAARFLVRFDFAAGRLLFDPMGDALCFLSEFRTKAQALDAAKVMRLRECLYRNGRFEVWDAAGEVKLGESQPYLPFNCRIDFSAIAAAIAAVEALAATLE